MDESNALQIRYASHSFNQWLGPIKEAPSNEGAFLVSDTPHREGIRGGVLVTVGGSAASGTRYSGSPFYDSGDPLVLAII